MRATPTFKMLLTMLLAGLAVLGAGEEMNTTSTASPKVHVSSTTVTKTMSTSTEPSPPFAAVMDLFQAPLAAFKAKMEDRSDMPMGRNQENTATTPAPSNIFFKAGNGLGSAASSLTGWFNNRMIPQVFRPSSSTTAAPEVFAIIPSQQVRRKVLVASENGRRPLRQRPVLVDSDDLDDEQEANDDDGNYEYNSNHDTIEDEADYEPVKKRNGIRQTQKHPNRQYFYIEEELPENDDFDYDLQLPPVRKIKRKPQNSVNRRRKTPAKKKQQKVRKPVRKVQNPQIVQVVQNRPSNTQVKPKRRPAATFELVPITQSQAMNSIQNTKPSSITQNNQQRPVSQFLSIPWSRLGFAGPPKEPNSTEQQSKPIIIQIPQQHIKRKRRPTKKPAQPLKNPKRKPLRGQIQKQSPVFSILNEDQIREIFKTQLNEPSKTTPQTSNLPVTLDTKKKPPKNQSEDVPSSNIDNNPEEKPQAESEAENHDEDANAFIVVGPADEDDDKEIDLNLYRHYNNQRGFKRGRASSRINHRWEMGDDYDE